MTGVINDVSQTDVTSGRLKYFPLFSFACYRYCLWTERVCVFVKLRGYLIEILTGRGKGGKGLVNASLKHCKALQDNI